MFIAQYTEFKSASAMAVYYNVCKKTILKYAKKIGYVNGYRNSLIEDEINYVIENYADNISITLSKALNVSKAFITKTRRDHINED